MAKKHISQGMRESERVKMQRRLQADLPRTEASLREFGKVAADFSRQLDDLIEATVELINLPSGVDLAAHIKSITIDLMFDGKERQTAENLTRLMLHGSRADVNAALAWNAFDAAKKSEDPEIVRQRMADGAFFYGRACAANVDAGLQKTQSTGGKQKAANAKPNPETALAIEFSLNNPSLSATQIKMRAKLKASDRTIRKWLAESC